MAGSRVAILEQVWSNQCYGPCKRKYGRWYRLLKSRGLPLEMGRIQDVLLENEDDLGS